ncbi:vWA domain-containing protein [Microcoleus sp. F8_C2]
MHKTSTDLFFMIDFSIQKLKLITLATLFAILPLPALAASLEITRWRVEGDRVTLRVKVLDDRRIPIQGLKTQDFKVQTTDSSGNLVMVNPDEITLTSSDQVQIDPAYLVLLLDMSGSMKNKDLAGAQKLKSAINGIREFIREVRDKRLPVSLALVPFGEGGSGCLYDFAVNEIVIKQNLLDANSSKIDKQLEQLENIKVCSATNIYQPVAKAVEYLGEITNSLNSNKLVQNSQNIPPKLGVILLSDGYDVYRSNESERFQELLQVLQQNPQVTVHTMGYGEKLNELRDRAHRNNPNKCPITGEKLTVDNVVNRCRLSGEDIREYIVDERRLTEIAEVTRGIHLFPGNPKEVIDSLRTFLTTLREYELVYRQPGADRASLHKTVAQVRSPFRQLNLTSEPQNIRLNNFAYRSPSWQERFIIFIIILLLSLASILLFLKWSQNLKAEAEQG